MNLNEQIVSLFDEAKNNNILIPIIDSPKYKNINSFFLAAVGKTYTSFEEFVEYSTLWRNKNKDSFFSVFEAVTERTRNWIYKSIINNNHRIFFAICDNENKLYGQYGLEFHSSDQTIEIGNIIKGDIDIKGLMTTAMLTLSKWLFDNTSIEFIYLLVFSDNVKAINLYRRIGFTIVENYHYSLINRPNNEKLWSNGIFPDSQAAKAVYKMILNRDIIFK
jgi:RimJ/RimL family protein N-acetyltransferase